MSEKLQNLILLTRINKPIGYMLLFWPCVWGLTISYDFNQSFNKFIFYSILFFVGSVLMRTAGCIINDIVDRKYDKKVERTKFRPIASGKISILNGLALASSLCLVAFFVLIQFNKLTIIVALISMPLAFTYPYMKRYTYWPQLYLGITFNYGLLLGWISTQNNISLIPIIFYIGAIFWTLGYDTIYGYQDIKDDEIIGLKSTSIKFKKNPKIFLTVCYFMTSFIFLLVGFLMNFKIYFFMFFIIPLIHLFFLQIYKVKITDGVSCLKIFKSNNFFGFLIFVSFLIGKIL